MTSQLRVDKITPVDGVPSGGGGGIIQMVQAVKTDTFRDNSDSFQDISGLSATITPKFSTSKVLIQLSLTYGGDADCYAYGQLVRDSTPIDIGTAEGNRPGASFTLNSGTTNATYANKLFNLSYFFLDSPNTTLECTYGIAVADHNNGTQTFYLNRMGVTSGEPYAPYLSSSIFAMEVVA